MLSEAVEFTSKVSNWTKYQILGCTAQWGFRFSWYWTWEIYLWSLVGDGVFNTHTNALTKIFFKNDKGVFAYYKIQSKHVNDAIGDEIVNEVPNGLFSIGNQKRVITTPIGIMPIGSNNSLNWIVLGVMDSVSAALAIVEEDLICYLD